MRLITIFVVTIIGLVNCTITPSTKQQCAACQMTLDWVRTNENLLSYIKFDEQFGPIFIKLLESNELSENLCGLLTMCDANDDFLDQFWLGGIGRAIGHAISHGIGRGIGRGIAHGIGRGIGRGIGSGIGRGIGRGVGRRIGRGFGRGVARKIGRGFGRGISRGVKIHRKLKAVRRTIKRIRKGMRNDDNNECVCNPK